MPKTSKIPAALTIGGSDSGGGAGIQADLKTFASLGVHGTSAITCVTAQNPRRIRAVQPIRPEIVRLQIQAVFDELRPAAVKTGMLFSAEIIHAVVEFFRAAGPRPPLVVDPVMVATSGTRLLKRSAVRAVQRELLPIATLVTPNLEEAGILLDSRLNSVQDMRRAAREIQARYGCAALVKGGHLRHLKEAVDVFNDGMTERLLAAPFIRGVATHGTGCTYSAAIAACLASGCDLLRAVQRAKRYITLAIARSLRVRGHSVLDSLGKTGAGIQSASARNSGKRTRV